jgi:hypothetical protein
MWSMACADGQLIKHEKIRAKLCAKVMAGG